MKQSFEEYLMSYHAENYPTLDDLLPEAFADWISEVDPDTIIELAEKWHKKETDKNHSFAIEIIEVVERTGLSLLKIGDKLYKIEQIDESPKTIKVGSKNSYYVEREKIEKIIAEKLQTAKAELAKCNNDNGTSFSEDGGDVLVGRVEICEELLDYLSKEVANE